MHLKDLAIFADVANQYLSNDFKHPAIVKLAKKEFNAWFKQTDRLIDSFKKQFKDEAEIEDFDDKVACVYELVKTALLVPKEEREKLTDTFKNINNDIENRL